MQSSYKNLRVKINKTDLNIIYKQIASINNDKMLAHRHIKYNLNNRTQVTQS